MRSADVKFIVASYVALAAFAAGVALLISHLAQYTPGGLI